MNLGAVYGRIGQYETGIEHLSRALELQPDNPEPYKNIGLIYKAQGRYSEAIENLEKALKLQIGRGDLQTHLNIGDTYRKMAQHEKAIPYYQKAIQLNPNHANAHLLLGLSYRALKRSDQARVLFEKTLELEPDHPQAAQIRTVAGTDPKIVTGPTSFTEKYVRAKSSKPIVRFQVISNKPDALQIWCNPVFRSSYWARGAGTTHIKSKYITWAISQHRN